MPRSPSSLAVPAPQVRPRSPSYSERKTAGGYSSCLKFLEGQLRGLPPQVRSSLLAKIENKLMPLLGEDFFKFGVGASDPHACKELYFIAGLAKAMKDVGYGVDLFHDNTLLPGHYQGHHRGEHGGQKSLSFQSLPAGMKERLLGRGSSTDRKALKRGQREFTWSHGALPFQQTFTDGLIASIVAEKAGEESSVRMVVVRDTRAQTGENLFLTTVFEGGDGQLYFIVPRTEGGDRQVMLSSGSDGSSEGFHVMPMVISVSYPPERKAENVTRFEAAVSGLEEGQELDESDIFSPLFTAVSPSLSPDSPEEEAGGGGGRVEGEEDRRESSGDKELLSQFPPSGDLAAAASLEEGGSSGGSGSAELEPEEEGSSHSSTPPPPPPPAIVVGSDEESVPASSNSVAEEEGEKEKMPPEHVKSNRALVVAEVSTVLSLKTLFFVVTPTLVPLLYTIFGGKIDELLLDNNVPESVDDYVARAIDQLLEFLGQNDLSEDPKFWEDFVLPFMHFSVYSAIPFVPNFFGKLFAGAWASHLHIRREAALFAQGLLEPVLVASEEDRAEKGELGEKVKKESDGLLADTGVPVYGTAGDMVRAQSTYSPRIWNAVQTHLGPPASSTAAVALLTGGLAIAATAYWGNTSEIRYVLLAVFLLCHFLNESFHSSVEARKASLGDPSAFRLTPDGP